LAAIGLEQDVLRERLSSSTLTGLGGAHFPFATKVAAVLQKPGPRYVVANGAEDEPGSQKDKVLIERNPHVVIEGALLAAAAVEADEVIFYIRESLVEAFASMSEALSEVAADGLAGDRVLRLHAAPTDYVAGEASAAVRSLEGEDAKPNAQPPYPSEIGYLGQPTLVSNVETFANLPRMLSDDASVNTSRSRLATVIGDVVSPGVFEVDPLSTSLRDLVLMAGGVTSGANIKALQPGGPSSAYVTVAQLDANLTNESIREIGSQPGCLAVRVVAENRCMVEEVAGVAAFFAREQCGQCPGCRMKTSTYSTLLGKVVQGAANWELLGQFATIDEFVADMPRKCALIDMPTAPVMSAVEHFRSDFADHIDNGQCSARDVSQPEK
jgi:NADH-quinone oxidoreductase subunit F